ncbi:hypothetical protein KKE60_07890 [Patescibacteria group bacterium]|nr:hypothetical protein [Patescibacteria group bacterium]
MAEDALDFNALIVHVASQLGVAYYGAAGNEVAQAPTDTYTLQAIKDYVNGGIRMLLNDAPPEGWRCQQPTASIDLWATVSGICNGAPAFGDPESTVTVHARTFIDSMLGHKLKFTVTSTADGAPSYDSDTEVSIIDVDDAIFSGVFAVGQTITFDATDNSYVVNTITDTTTVIVDGDASGEADGDTVTITRDYVIEAVTSALVVDVTGDASGEADGATVTVTANGNYTLPSTFGGEYLGPITYAAGENPGASIEWGSEGTIRRLQENTSSQTGYPSMTAVRKSDTARRWELIVYPTPGGNYTVEFPYELYFTALSAVTDLHPFGAHYDEAVMAACEAYAEMKGADILAGRVQYYEQKALPAAHRRNTRSAPRKLGSLLKRRIHISNWRDYYERPDVTIP